MKLCDISVIIPHYNSLDSLKRLFNTIPNSKNIEVLLVDNSCNPISKDMVGVSRNYKLLHSPNSRFAGGARNVGIDAAQGKWLIFADADDFFTPEAFDVFSSYINSENDLIYFKVKSVYDDTLLPSSRGDMWNKVIDDFNNKVSDEISTRLSYVVPWGKMIRRDFVVSNDIRFDEVVAANDVMFSTKCGLYANLFKVDHREVYVVTTRAGSLANRRDFDVIKSRYLVALQRNKFLREKGYKNKQGSVMIYLYLALKFGPKSFLSFCELAIKYRQNPFIGYRHWFKTFISTRKESKINKKYITH